MKKTCQRIAATLCALAATVAAQAADKEDKAQSAQTVQVAPAGKPPAMADLPFMKEEAKRLAALMERLQKETDPAERRKIMAETTCAQ
jgi:Holliday junction resolvasome RuvABC DNA-binding subunit